MSDKENKVAKQIFEVLNVKQIYFLGEQDGPAERKLKDQLVSLMRAEPSVKSAYLAKIHFGDRKSFTVCLCIEPVADSDKKIVEKAAAVFKSLAPSTAHLDIIFPSADQQVELSKVCKPFFRQVLQ
jgi:hypothetical protein